MGAQAVCHCRTDTRFLPACHGLPQSATLVKGVLSLVFARRRRRARIELIRKLADQCAALLWWLGLWFSPHPEHTCTRRRRRLPCSWHKHRRQLAAAPPHANVAICTAVSRIMLRLARACVLTTALLATINSDVAPTADAAAPPAQCSAGDSSAARPCAHHFHFAHAVDHVRHAITYSCN